MANSKTYFWGAAMLAPLSLLVSAPAEMLFLDLTARANAAQITNDLSHTGSGPIMLFAYPTMLIVGIPSYLILRRYKLWSIWSAGLAGYVSTFIGCFLLLCVLAASEGTIGPTLIADTFRRLSLPDALVMAAFGLNGLVVGLTFWLIAKYLTFDDTISN
jgi:hypothetical protein